MHKSVQADALWWFSTGHHVGEQDRLLRVQALELWGDAYMEHIAHCHD